MYNFNVNDLLESLPGERPVFHSEADFQHALAWKIQRTYPDASIRLEKQVATSDDRFYPFRLDLLINNNHLSQQIAIELKYKTRRLETNIKGERFDLRNQSAQNWGRYGFFRDLARIEQYVARYPNSEGYAVFLTNDPTYWEEGMGNDVNDLAFRIQEGRYIMAGKYDWHPSAGEAVRRGHPAIQINSSYDKIAWHDFSRIDDKHLFRYAVIKVPSVPPAKLSVITSEI